MTRIKIKNLQMDQKISKAEMRTALGGGTYLHQRILPQGEDLVKAGRMQMYGLGNFRYMYGAYGKFG